MYDIRNEKLDIIVIAGQSNAEGNGLSNDNFIEIRNDVLEMIDFNDYYYDLTNPSKPFLKITLPVKCKIQPLQEKVADGKAYSNFAFTFAEEYIKSKYYDKSRKILVIKSAVGGTGFCKNEWGVNSSLYNRTLDMVNLALSYNKENKLVALLWHQGECDAFENATQPLIEKKNFYINKFMEQTLDFKKRYNVMSLPVIMGEFVNEWSDLKENKDSTKAIEEALYECANKLGNSLVVSSGSLLSNNQMFNNGDNIHFCKDSLKELGKRYYQAFDKIMKK